MIAQKAFLTVFHDDDYCHIIRGPDAAAAAREHYDEADATCPPRDPAFAEEFSVTAYEIPTNRPLR